MAPAPTLLVLGIRGIPAQHGGFETFAERLALYLVSKRWNVIVYCQKDVAAGSPEDGRITVDQWRGVQRVTIAVGERGSFGTVVFDNRSVHHAARSDGIPLVLGYNTAVLTLKLRLRSRPVIMNMDGIEWKRSKWSRAVRAWFWLNEWIGSLASSLLVADHPEIAEHHARQRSRRNIVMIPYGADVIDQAPVAPLEPLGVAPGKYVISICRIEPENSVLPLIKAFSSSKRNIKFLCLGTLDSGIPYHRQVREAASDEVIFPGAIYDHDTVRALRFHASVYCHGHTVGGTNPSLVEALGAGNAILAHSNKYNRWTAGREQFYFESEEECRRLFDTILHNDHALSRARAGARARHAAHFMWDGVLTAYEEVLRKFHTDPGVRSSEIGAARLT
ncbi:DUF1972 domain-containing protein [Geminicoccus harenae]|uniref:DUF1972 domain-containing protein n=1 Tax=Geminicoccus harenae TaxID=2498453 RepID=UPI00168A7681|nr:DUF1972 domain-containing protein [Geminicoccus harenae]